MNHKPATDLAVQKLANPDDGTFFPFEVDWITQTQADFSSNTAAANPATSPPAPTPCCRGPLSTTARRLMAAARRPRLQRPRRRHHRRPHRRHRHRRPSTAKGWGALTNHKLAGQIIVQKLANPDDGTFLRSRLITQTQADFSLQHGGSHNSGDLAPVRNGT